MDKSKINQRGRASHLPAAPNRNGSDKDHVMAYKALPSPEVLRQLLRYEPDTGRMFWLPRGTEWFRNTSGRTAEHARAIWNALYAGSEAFTNKASNGYLVGGIFKGRHMAHRVAWAVEHGAWPHADIDHINRVRDDNRLCNLRSVSKSENSKNRSSRTGKPDELVGVFPAKAGRFLAIISVGGKSRNLGTHDTPEAARAAYLQAQADYTPATQDRILA